jgi:hypothetical protein
VPGHAGLRRRRRGRRGDEPDSSSSPVRRGEGEPDGRAPPVSARGREGGRRGQPGPGWEMGRARGERKGRRGRAVAGCAVGKRKEREEGGGPAGLGPRKKRGMGREGKIKQLLLNLKMKFEFKRNATKIPIQRA